MGAKVLAAFLVGGFFLITGLPQNSLAAGRYVEARVETQVIAEENGRLAVKMTRTYYNSSASELEITEKVPVLSGIMVNFQPLAQSPGLRIQLNSNWVTIFGKIAPNVPDGIDSRVSFYFELVPGLAPGPGEETGFYGASIPLFYNVPSESGVVIRSVQTRVRLPKDTTEIPVPSKGHGNGNALILTDLDHFPDGVAPRGNPGNTQKIITPTVVKHNPGFSLGTDRLEGFEMGRLDLEYRLGSRETGSWLTYGSFLLSLVAVLFSSLLLVAGRRGRQGGRRAPGRTKQPTKPS